MRRVVIVLLVLLPMGTARDAPTCETLLADLEHTAASARSVTRTLTMNAGDRELSRSVVKVVQGEDGLELTTLEQTGQLPPRREGAPGPESSLLGLPPGLACEGHTLTETETGYELNLVVADEESPVDSVVLELRRQGERLVSIGYAAAGSITQLFFTSAISLTMSYGDWVFR